MPIDISYYLPAISAGTARLLSSAAALDDQAAAAPSQLPGWNRAMVLTHLARNADGIAGMLEGARRAQVVHQYPHGREGRAADIEAGRNRPASALLADLTGGADRLGTAAAMMSDKDWQAPGEAFSGRVPVARMLVSRLREVEVHHSDLGLAYGPDQWPPEFVAAEMAAAVAELPRRLPPGTAIRLVGTGGGQPLGEWHAGAEAASAAAAAAVVSAPAGQLLAWLLGRPSTVANPPPLAPWQ